MKVQQGVFERIPEIYSDELFEVIKSCLNLNSAERPNCEEILRISGKYLKKDALKNYRSSSLDMLKTIKFSNNTNML